MIAHKEWYDAMLKLIIKGQAITQQAGDSSLTTVSKVEYVTHMGETTTLRNFYPLDVASEKWVFTDEFRLMQWQVDKYIIDALSDISSQGWVDPLINPTAFQFTPLDTSDDLYIPPSKMTPPYEFIRGNSFTGDTEGRLSFETFEAGEFIDIGDVPTFATYGYNDYVPYFCTNDGEFAAIVHTITTDHTDFREGTTYIDRGFSVGSSLGSGWLTATLIKNSTDIKIRYTNRNPSARDAHVSLSLCRLFNNNARNKNPQTYKGDEYITLTDSQCPSYTMSPNTTVSMTDIYDAGGSIAIPEGGVIEFFVEGTSGIYHAPYSSRMQTPLSSIVRLLKDGIRPDIEALETALWFITNRCTRLSLDTLSATRVVEGLPGGLTGWIADYDERLYADDTSVYAPSPLVNINDLEVGERIFDSTATLTSPSLSLKTNSTGRVTSYANETWKTYEDSCSCKSYTTPCEDDYISSSTFTLRGADVLVDPATHPIDNIGYWDVPPDGMQISLASSGVNTSFDVPSYTDATPERDAIPFVLVPGSLVYLLQGSNPTQVKEGTFSNVPTSVERTPTSTGYEERLVESDVPYTNPLLTGDTIATAISCTLNPNDVPTGTDADTLLAALRTTASTSINGIQSTELHTSFGWVRQHSARGSGCPYTTIHNRESNALLFDMEYDITLDTKVAYFDIVQNDVPIIPFDRGTVT